MRESTGGTPIMIEPNTLPSFDGIPPGCWVLVSQDRRRIVAFDSDLSVAFEKAVRNGENRPLIAGLQ